MVCRLALRNLVMLQNPVSHPLICHKPGMKTHRELRCYECQSEISMDFNVARLLLDITRDRAKTQLRVPLPAGSCAETCQQLSVPFQQSPERWERAPCMQYRGAFGDQLCFDPSASPETKAKLKRRVLKRGMLLLFSLYQYLSTSPIRYPGSPRDPPWHRYLGRQLE